MVLGQGTSSASRIRMHQVERPDRLGVWTRHRATMSDALGFREGSTMDWLPHGYQHHL
jgi:hypothetical protein